MDLGHTVTQAAETNASFRESLTTVLNNIFGAIITSQLVNLPAWLLPNSLQDMKVSLKNVNNHISALIDQERTAIRASGIAGANRLSALLKASEDEAMGKERSGFNDEEIIGNLFIYNVAGYDTTANALVYALTFLSTDFGLQDWLHEEISSVLGDRSETKEGDYETTFPKLKRCFALMVGFNCSSRGKLR
jgi:cytochrome P450